MEESNQVGRPSKYTPELCERLCELIATTDRGLRSICKELEVNTSTVIRWLQDETKPEFRTQYARAREDQADFLAEQIIEIADDGTNDFMTITKGDQEYTVENKEWTSRSKLRVEARKWIASKLKPKKYGDKLDITSKDNPINNNIVLTPEKTAELKKQLDSEY